MGSRMYRNSDCNETYASSDRASVTPFSPQSKSMGGDEKEEEAALLDLDTPRNVTENTGFLTVAQAQTNPHAVHSDIANRFDAAPVLHPHLQSVAQKVSAAVTEKLPILQQQLPYEHRGQQFEHTQAMHSQYPLNHGQDEPRQHHQAHAMKAEQERLNQQQREAQRQRMYDQQAEADAARARRQLQEQEAAAARLKQEADEQQRMAAEAKKAEAEASRLKKQKLQDETERERLKKSEAAHKKREADEQQRRAAQQAEAEAARARLQEETERNAEEERQRKRDHEAAEKKAEAARKKRETDEQQQRRRQVNKSQSLELPERPYTQIESNGEQPTPNPTTERRKSKINPGDLQSHIAKRAAQSKTVTTNTQKKDARSGGESKAKPKQTDMATQAKPRMGTSALGKISPGDLQSHIKKRAAQPKTAKVNAQKNEGRRGSVSNINSDMLQSKTKKPKQTAVTAQAQSRQGSMSGKIMAGDLAKQSRNLKKRAAVDEAEAKPKQRAAAKSKQTQNGQAKKDRADIVPQRRMSMGDVGQALQQGRAGLRKTKKSKKKPKEKENALFKKVKSVRKWFSKEDDEGDDSEWDPTD